MHFSLIIPVFNRPDEVDELLESLTRQTFKSPYEIVIVEDGSTLDCEHIVKKYSSLNISYFKKPNSGPGDSRNFGMKNAKGDYFIILDSDCIIPKDYLQIIDGSLSDTYVDFFGGVDAASDSFSDIQKAINFAMTSFLSTGGIRGGSEKIGKFQPRSFNMGISKKAFEASQGFGNIHPGEDPDLTIRLWKMGFKSKLIKEASVFHKRRIDWPKFRLQVSKFGKVRPILNAWHPEYAKLTFWFPSVFICGFFFSVFALIKTPIFLIFYIIYFVLIFVMSSFQNHSLKIGFYTVYAIFSQFWGYGLGFLESYFKIFIQKQKPEIAFPNLFFKK